jgi:hypothetical protein
MRYRKWASRWENEEKEKSAPKERAGGNTLFQFLFSSFPNSPFSISPSALRRMRKPLLYRAVFSLALGFSFLSPSAPKENTYRPI